MFIRTKQKGSSIVIYFKHYNNKLIVNCTRDNLSFPFLYCLPCLPWLYPVSSLASFPPPHLFSSVADTLRTAVLLENKLRRRLQLPGTDRCSAGCRVARRVGYRCMTDRYHNHTSPLLSLTYWIKHLPSCSRIALPRLLKSGGRGSSSSVSEVTREKLTMIPSTRRSPKLFLSQASPNRVAIWQHFVPGCWQRKGPWFSSDTISNTSWQTEDKVVLEPLRGLTEVRWNFWGSVDKKI